MGPCSCRRDLLGGLTPQSTADPLPVGSRGPISQQPHSKEPVTRRPDHTQSQRILCRVTMQPQNASVQWQKPRNQPLPHSQMQVNMQPPGILITVRENPDSAAHKGIRHKSHSTLNSLSHCHSDTGTATDTKSQDSRGMHQGNNLTHSQGHSSQNTRRPHSHAVRVAHSLTHTQLGAQGEGLDQPQSHKSQIQRLSQSAN